MFEQYFTENTVLVTVSQLFVITVIYNVSVFLLLVLAILHFHRLTAEITDLKTGGSLERDSSVADLLLF